MSQAFTLKGTGDGPLPPILQQYVEFKSAFPDHLVLYQIGDFFETFGEDAETVAQVINLALTSKNSKEFTTPMAGIPIRSVDTHLERLLRAGFRVAVAEQVSDDNDGEGLMSRQVTQLITPGTIADEGLLQPDANYLAAIAHDGTYGLALLDVSTGEFTGTEIGSASALRAELLRFGPTEVLLQHGLRDDVGHDLEADGILMHESSQQLIEEDTARLIREQFGSVPAEFISPAVRQAAAMTLQYARRVQGGTLPQVTRFTAYKAEGALQLDGVTLTALEIFQGSGPLRTGVRTTRIRSLFDALNSTRTAPGKRLLRTWLRQPLLDTAAIEQRLDAVELFVTNPRMRSTVRTLLGQTQDLERLTARLTTGNANPRDLKALERTLGVLPELQEAMRTHQAVHAWFQKRRPLVDAVVRTISRALGDNPPVKTAEGGFIRDGFDAELDALRGAAVEAQEWMQELERKERKATGISTLRVASNSALGYFFEVSKAHDDKVPDSFELLQSLKDRQRYTRDDLRKRQSRMMVATEEAAGREQVLFRELVREVAQHVDALRAFSQMLARIDVYASFAEMAVVHKYVRPSFNADEFIIDGGRHPVVERGVTFVRNNLELNRDRSLVVLTGPNMSGKSTYLRQQALVCIMAQVGSFVPAERAVLPVFERIFTRIGASDDLAGGRSTFMVEMEELAAILQNATPRSLVLLDEIGRGTSTYDGLAIAWATTEHLHNVSRAFALFATHYFELTRLADELPHAVNQHVAAEESDGEMVFYHQVLPGPANRSYGVEVARLAGVPASVVSRAQEVLGHLESPDALQSRRTPF